ncbi:MAG TPA: hypothetical protein VK989_03445 [Polyangia bacterium]|nr:hypothetical protein [Polyangia bacterium]
MTRLVLATALVLALAGRARAELPPPAPAVAPLAPTLAAGPPQPQRWYGWQTLAIDVLSAGALALDVRANGARGFDDRAFFPLAGVEVGAPIVHAMHRHWVHAAISLAARVVVPSLITLAVGVQDNDWSNRDASWGFVGGALAVGVVDAASSWDAPR